MSDESDFFVALDAFVERSHISFKEAMKRVAFDVHDRIVDRTPIDAGQARASWNLSVNSPDTTLAKTTIIHHERNAQGRFVKGGTRTTTHGLSPEDAAAKSKKSQSKVNSFDPYADTIWLTNAVPYILQLEHGSSKQAPVGMVAVTLAEVEAGILVKAL